MPCVSRSARCDSLPRSARIPPWIFGCSVTTRWSSISGEPVTSSTVVTGSPASAIARAVPPLETSSTPSSCRPGREVHQARLVVHRQQRAHQTLALSPGSSCDQPPEHRGVQAALDVLDPLVQGLRGVVVEDGHRLLGEDRAVVHLERGVVDGAAGDLHAGGERVVDRVPALERREQRRVGVHDAAAGTGRGSACRGSCRSRPSPRGPPGGARARRRPGACRRGGRSPRRSCHGRWSRRELQPAPRARWRRTDGRR